MHICLFNLSKYEVSLFHLYIAFYAILITASSSYNKIMSMICQRLVFLAVDFAKSNYCAKSN